MKVANSSLVKFGALPETKNSGNPCCANISLSLQTVSVDVVESMMCVSIHFDVIIITQVLLATQLSWIDITIGYN